MWNLDTVLSSKPVLPLARSDCKDGVISLDNIHNDVSMYKSKGNSYCIVKENFSLVYRVGKFVYIKHELNKI